MAKKIRIGIIAQGDIHWVGGVEYTKNLVLALANLPSSIRNAFELYLICHGSSCSAFYAEIIPFLDRVYYLDSELKPLNLFDRICAKIIRTLFMRCNSRFDDFIRRNKIDFIYPCERPNAAAHRSASWISDFQHKYLPQFFDECDIKYRDEWFTFIARHASVVILSSNTAKADFDKFFPYAAHKSRALPFRVTPLPKWYEANPRQTQENYHLPDRFFLISNQFWQHKNHLVVFKALEILKEKSIYPVVVCTGHLNDCRQPSYMDDVMQAIHTSGIAEQVCIIGLIPKSDQIQLLRRSLAVIQPSLFEGWSTVVEEARCLGKPIVLSDIPVHREQAIPHSTFFECASAEQLSVFLADMWKNLSSGPDLDREAIARAEALNNTRDFGCRFLEIAREELDKKRGNSCF